MTSFAEHIGEYSFRDGAGFSPDNFLYARCEAVARGEAVYRRVLGAPEDMPKENTFETLLYAAQQAYETKTGRDYEHIPSIDVETFANKEGWRE